jgi:hypothetical protein
MRLRGRSAVWSRSSLVSNLSFALLSSTCRQKHTTQRRMLSLSKENPHRKTSLLISEPVLKIFFFVTLSQGNQSAATAGVIVK